MNSAMTLTCAARLGPYEILGVSGRGGMGEVYRARDTRLDRTVAIKILPAEIQRDTQRRQRMRREAQVVAALSHPGICALYDVGSDGEVDFLVMEFVEGETLAERLKRSPLPLPEVLPYMAPEQLRGLAACTRSAFRTRMERRPSAMPRRPG